MSSNVRLAGHEGYVFIVITAMTPTQVRTVQESFRLLAPSAQRATQVFYDELFRLDPELRQLFPRNLEHQKGKFVQMLSTVVRSLTNVSAISDHVADLGRRHASYDVRESDYLIVGEALIIMLRRVLGGNCTPEVENAWAAAYNMLARTMLETGAAPHEAGSFFSHVVRGVLTAEYGISTGLSPSQEERGLLDRGPPRIRRRRSP